MLERRKEREREQNRERRKNSKVRVESWHWCGRSRNKVAIFHKMMECWRVVCNVEAGRAKLRVG